MPGELVSGLGLKWVCPPNSRSALMNVSEKDRKQDQIFLSFFLFFSDRPFHGQFSQDDSIIIPQRRLPPPNPMGGLSKGKRKRKRKEKLKKIW